MKSKPSERVEELLKRCDYHANSDKPHRDILTIVRELEEACQAVMDYHLGNGKYNFSNLSEYDRSNTALDARLDIRKQLDRALRGKK